MNCAQFLELAEAHAAGALDPSEAAEAEAHLRESTHQGCPQALTRAQSGWAALALSLDPLQPPPRVWAAIEARVGPHKALRMRWREQSAVVLALAACLLLVAMFVRERSRDSEQDAIDRTLARRDVEQAAQISKLMRELDEQRAALSLLQSPSAVMVPLQPQAGAGERASAIVDLGRRTALVLASALHPQPGRDYELWVIAGSAKLPAGLLRQGPSGYAMVRLDDKLLAGGADALAVTVEPTGGSPQPTGAIVLLGKVPKA